MKSRYWIYLGIFLLGCLLALAETKGHRFETNDWRVYYYATQDFFAGNNPYLHSYGLSTGFFKYPPTTLYFFGPIVGVPYWLTQWMQLFLSIISLIGSSELMHRLFQAEVKGKSWPFLLVAFLTVAVSVVREWHLGNINLQLLFLFLLGWWMHRRSSKWWWLPWAIMILFKPTSILILLPFLVSLNGKIILRFAVIGILFFLVPIAHLGWQGNWKIWLAWWTAASAHGDYLESHHMLAQLADNLWMGSGTYFSLFFLSIFIGLLVYLRWNKKVNLEKVFVLLPALIPLLFLTDTNHFVLLLPLIYSFMHSYWSKLTIIAKVGLALCLVAFTTESTDLWSPTLSKMLSNWGVMGWASLVLVVSYGGWMMKDESSVG